MPGVLHINEDSEVLLGAGDKTIFNKELEGTMPH